MLLLINPGSGPLAGASEANAETNLQALLVDALGAEACKVERKGADGKGRWTFIIRARGKECEVDVPGCTLERLTGDDAFPPRLYVNGSSWIWGFAVSMVHDAIFGEAAEG